MPRESQVAVIESATVTDHESHASTLVHGRHGAVMSPAYRAVILAAAVAFVCIQLFVPPILGVADNRDYQRLMTEACIGPESVARFPYFDYFVPHFIVSGQYCGSIIPSSARIPLILSLGLTRLFLPQGHYDLRFLAAVYAVLLLTALWFFLRRLARTAPIARELVAAAVLLIFFSAVYIPLLNSFYIDAAAFVFFLWAVILALDVLTAAEVGLLEYLALALAILLVATTKIQHIPLALCFLPALWLRFARRRFPALWLRLCISGVVVAGSLLFLRACLPWNNPISLYNSVFYKLLPACDNPRAELPKLGLGPEYEQYIGQHAFSEGSPMGNQDFARTFGRKVTVPKVFRFLLTHPAAAARALRHDLEEASLERVRMKIGEREYRLGNYEANSGHAPESQSAFLTFWSRFKLAVYGGRPWAYLAYILALLLILWIAALRQPTRRAEARAAIGMLTVMLPASFVPVFLDAVDTGRHLFLFNCMLDMGACALLWLVLRWWRERRPA
jgi:hypothetical protein